MYKKLLILVLLVTCGVLHAQEARKKKADTDYDKFAYIKASELYERLINQGYESADIYGKLGDTYYFNAVYGKAEAYYGKMLALEKEARPEYYFRYAQCLKAAGKYEEAEKTLARFYELVGQPEGQRQYLQEELAGIRKFSGRYDITDAGVNSDEADFGTAFGAEGEILFASARDEGIFIKRTHEWNGKPFLKLYKATPGEDGTLQSPEQLGGDVNTKYHQSTPAVSKDGKTMYFTRNNFIPGKYKKGEDGTNNLKIYRASFMDGKWKAIEELSINSDDYSSAHPALSPDGRHLYFVSDRSGTRGLSDLFVVEIRDNGSFGPVQNLGDAINTRGRETFPFMSDSGVLYFASDGHPGFGGLDIFAAVRDPFGNYQVVNVGEPVNSPADDFGYIINDSTKRGYFSSGRNGESGGDNIYILVENNPIAIAAELCGHVRDSLTKEALAGTSITIYDENNRKLKNLLADDAGDFCVEVLAGQNYNLRFEKDKYQSYEEFVTKLEIGDKKELLAELNKEDIPVTDGDDLTKKLGLKPIYFDFDRYSIRKDSEIELGKVIAAMQQHPGMVIEVRSHTDSRGNDQYNMELSERRAVATVDYIVNKGGISRNRISGKGYGETEPVNECADGTGCTAEQHWLNRRSEFMIVKM
ncbi:OmpA family protein [Sinomicrobium sp. M5D2P17]